MPRSRRIQTVRCGRFGNDADSFEIDRPIKSIGRAFTQSRRASLGTAAGAGRRGGARPTCAQPGRLRGRVHSSCWTHHLIHLSSHLISSRYGLGPPPLGSPPKIVVAYPSMSRSA